MNPFNLEPSNRMISSRVVSCLVDDGPLRTPRPSPPEARTIDRQSFAALIFSAVVSSSLHLVSSFCFSLMLLDSFSAFM